jgi:hypothetical protein
MAAPVARYLRRLPGRQAWIEGHALVMDHQQQLLLEMGRVLMMLAAVILTHLLGTTAAASELLPIALLLWLIATALTMTLPGSSRRLRPLASMSQGCSVTTCSAICECEPPQVSSSDKIDHAVIEPSPTYRLLPSPFSFVSQNNRMA